MILKLKAFWSWPFYSWIQIIHNVNCIHVYQSSILTRSAWNFSSKQLLLFTLSWYTLSTDDPLFGRSLKFYWCTLKSPLQMIVCKSINSVRLILQNALSESTEHCSFASPPHILKGAMSRRQRRYCFFQVNSLLIDPCLPLPSVLTNKRQETV